MKQGNRIIRFRDILFWPTSCLLQLSPLTLFVAMILITLAGSILYTRINFNFWGLTAVDYSIYKINTDFSVISGDGLEWALSFETSDIVEFEGKIRHISPIRMRQFRILSHDVLVTSGDFANPDLVKTNVTNHMFTWRSSMDNKPEGSINLFHTVPQNQETYDQLWSLNQNDRVIFKGYEIQKIKLMDDDGNVKTWWEDKGCNTLLVTSVQIINNQ